MFEFTDSQMISCTDTNLQSLDQMQELMDNHLYALDVETNEAMGEMSKLIQSLRVAALKCQYDAEIAKFTELRKSL